MAQSNPPSAAQSLYPHLPSAAREPVKQRTPSLADALFPSLSREAKAKERDQALWDRICERNRANLLRGLREWRRGR
jgi:hypothetical protein